MTLKESATKGYWPNETSKKKSYKPLWDQIVTIKNVCPVHGGDCVPSKQNRIITMQRAGKFINNVPKQVMYNLCNVLEFSGNLPTLVIKKIFAPIFPKSKVITKTDVFGIRVKVMRLLPSFKKANGDYEIFKTAMNDSDLNGGITDLSDKSDDEAYLMARQVWDKVLGEHGDGNSNDTIMSFADYLNIISHKAKEFSYQLARNSSGVLVGAIWMTATMRRNFELFGTYLNLDALKRTINKLLWPYYGVTMYNELNKICLALEGFMCGQEQLEAYYFIAEFLAKHAPGRPLSTVAIVAGDGIFDQDTIFKMGFTRLTFVLDHWHLLDSGLRNKFGEQGHSLLRSHLVRLVKSTSEIEFESVLSAAEELIVSQQLVDGNLLSKLHDFAKERNSYAFYCLEKIPGNRGLLGSAAAEQNHASILMFLNDGQRGVNNYCENPANLIRDLLHRQHHHVKMTNTILAGHAQKLRVERNKLEKYQHDKINQELLKAAKLLNLPAYERFKSRLKRIHSDWTLEYKESVSEHIVFSL